MKEQYFYPWHPCEFPMSWPTWEFPCPTLWSVRQKPAIAPESWRAMITFETPRNTFILAIYFLNVIADFDYLVRWMFLLGLRVSSVQEWSRNQKSATSFVVMYFLLRDENSAEMWLGSIDRLANAEELGIKIFGDWDIEIFGFLASLCLEVSSVCSWVHLIVVGGVVLKRIFVFCFQELDIFASNTSWRHNFTPCSDRCGSG